MKHIHDILRHRLLLKAGIIPPEPIKPKFTMADLEGQWSPLFEQYMRNRLMMGALRYGLLKRKSGLKYDSVTSAIKRLCLYKETKNTEHLVDVANLCLVEFECSGNQFSATDEHDNHVKQIPNANVK